MRSKFFFRVLRCFSLSLSRSLLFSFSLSLSLRRLLPDGHSAHRAALISDIRAVKEHGNRMSPEAWRKRTTVEGGVVDVIAL